MLENNRIVFKVIMLGAPSTYYIISLAVGKSSMLVRYIKGNFT